MFNKSKFRDAFKPINKEETLQILNFCNRYFKQHKNYPDVKQIKTFIFKKLNRNLSKAQIIKVRNRLAFITKYQPVGDTGQHRNHGFGGLKVSSLGWIELDIMFLNHAGSERGQAIVVVDILSKMVYAESVKDKSLKSVKAFMNNLLKTPGFTNIRCVLSDQESAMKSLSRNNSDFPNIKFFITDKKAKTVERTIRSIKTLLSKIMILNKESTMHKWRNYLPEVLLKLNTKKLPGKIPGELDIVRPIDLNRRNVYKYIEYLSDNNPAYYKKHHQVLFPQNPEFAEKIFKFSVGDIVYLARKLVDKDEKNVKFQKKSILGNFTTDKKFKIITRKLEMSSNGYVVPIYGVESIEEEEREIFSLEGVYERYIRHYPDISMNPRNKF